MIEKLRKLSEVFWKAVNQNSADTDKEKAIVFMAYFRLLKIIYNCIFGKYELDEEISDVRLGDGCDFYMDKDLLSDNADIYRESCCYWMDVCTDDDVVAKYSGSLGLLIDGFEDSPIFETYYRPIELDMYESDLLKEDEDSVKSDYILGFTDKQSAFVYNEMENSFYLDEDELYQGDVYALKCPILDEFLKHHDESLEEKESYKNLVEVRNFLGRAFQYSKNVDGEMIYANVVTESMYEGVNGIDEYILSADFGLMVAGHIIESSLKDLGVI